MAAFRDSIPIGVAAVACGLLNWASAARTLSSGRGDPSFPISRAEGYFQSISHGRKVGNTLPGVWFVAATAAYTRREEARSPANNISRVTSRRIGKRRADPADARSALGP